MLFHDSRVSRWTSSLCQIPQFLDSLLKCDVVHDNLMSVFFRRAQITESSVNVWVFVTEFISMKWWSISMKSLLDWISLLFLSTWWSFCPLPIIQNGSHSRNDTCDVSCFSLFLCVGVFLGPDLTRHSSGVIHSLSRSPFDVLSSTSTTPFNSTLSSAYEFTLSAFTSALTFFSVLS